jgi:hypothetical protein
MVIQHKSREVGNCSRVLMESRVGLTYIRQRNLCRLNNGFRGGRGDAPNSFLLNDFGDCFAIRSTFVRPEGGTATAEERGAAWDWFAF